jgi:hypothetical protein
MMIGEETSRPAPTMPENCDSEVVAACQNGTHLKTIFLKSASALRVLREQFLTGIIAKK